MKVIFLARNLIILGSILISRSVWSQGDLEGQSNTAEMKKVLVKIGTCRLRRDPGRSTDEVLKSASCFDKYLSKELSPIRASGIIQWFNLLSDIRGRECDGEGFQIESFNQYTPDFICASGLDWGGNQKDNLIFFKKEGKDLKVWSIYEPMLWLRKKEK